MKILSKWSATISLLITLSACSDPSANPGTSQPQISTKITTQLTADQQRLWSNSCALCHVTGVGGAPRVGLAAEWTTRTAKGRDQLLKHTVEGFNNMPPLGYCMACESDDFVALIDFMAGDIQ